MSDVEALNLNPALEHIEFVSKYDAYHNQRLDEIYTLTENSHNRMKMFSKLLTKIFSLEKEARKNKKEETTLDPEAREFIETFRKECWPILQEVHNLDERDNPFPDSFSLEGKISLTDLEDTKRRLEQLSRFEETELSRQTRTLQQQSSQHETLMFVAVSHLRSGATGPTRAMVSNQRVR